MIKRPSHATVVAFVALLVASSGTAYAATGGSLILGRANGESTKTVLTNAQGIPLSLVAKGGLPPLIVNSSTKVKNLNADLLDGRPASAFQATPLNVTVVTSAISNVGGFAQCPFGYQVTGGGFNLPFVSDATKRDFVRQSNPDLSGPTPGWVVTLDPVAANNFQVNAPSTVYAVCVK